MMHGRAILSIGFLDWSRIVFEYKKDAYGSIKGLHENLWLFYIMLCES